MVWWIQVLEIADSSGKGIGKHRLTAKSDEDGGGPYGLCEHEHDTSEAASECPEARQNAEKF